MEAIGRALKRFGRVLFSLVIVGAVAVVTENPKWLIFAPVINAVAKYLRDKFNLDFIPL